MNYTPPRISIIVPNYNQEKYLKERLESIFNQTYQDFEVILLDDASTDGSKKIMEEFAERPEVTHFLVNQENSGSAFQQWKKGIRLAEGDYVWIAESDGFSDKRFLETMMDLFGREKNVDLAFCASWNVDEKGTKSEPATDPENSFYISGEGAAQKYFSKNNLIRDAGSCVFKRKLIEPSFYEYAYFEYYGDWRFWADLAGRAWKIAYLSEKLNYSRNHLRGNFPDIEKNKVYFNEGFLIVDNILKNEKITASARDQIYRFWGQKLYEAVFIRKEMNRLTRIWVLIHTLFWRFRILLYALWHEKPSPSGGSLARGLS
jgi:glycosyltransferase involved in cell wall biosynthesis